MATDDTDLIVACGGVLVWRNALGALGVVLVFREFHQDWSLPKGKLDPEEDELVCALREVYEETGIESTPIERLPPVTYAVPDGRTKRVHFWVMTPLQEPKTSLETLDSKEVALVQWTPLSGAKELLTYDTDRSILAEAESRLNRLGI